MVIKMEAPLYKIIKSYNAVAQKRISFLGVLLNIILYSAFFSTCVYFAVYKITERAALGYITSVPFFVFIAVRLYFFSKKDYIRKYHIQRKIWENKRIYSALMNMDEYSFTALCLEYLKRRYGVYNMKLSLNCWKNEIDVMVTETMPHAENKDISFINNMDVKGTVYVVTDKGTEVLF
ncbi:MAG: hypothetical protein E7315_03985 [Clostridiales bacterium]|nr:hypothetical protein [Clostridiales bacterium]